MERYIEKFLSYLEVEKNASVHTIASYLNDLKGFAGFLSQQGNGKSENLGWIDYLTLRKYAAFLREKKYLRATLARKLSTLRSFFKFLCREGYLKSNPISGMSTPKQEKRLPLFLVEDEVTRLLETPEKDLPGLRG